MRRSAPPTRGIACSVGFSRNSEYGLSSHKYSISRELDLFRTARWEYDSPVFREEFESGDYRVDENHALRNFFHWLSLDYILTFENEETGEQFSKVSPKRGNKEFAKRKWRKVREMNEGMKGLGFDFDATGHRGIYKMTYMVLITLTFRQDISKERAWYLLHTKGQELNRFNARLRKIFGSKATLRVKEAQANGYPAPHILLIVDRPIRVKRHRGKRGFSWRLASRILVNQVKSAWKWGFVDVEAVVIYDGGRYRGYHSPINYLTKYLTKSLDLSDHPELFKAKGMDEIPMELRARVRTHLWNKIARSRDLYISKAFKERLKVIPPRLDRYDLILKPDCCERWCLVGMEAEIKKTRNHIWLNLAREDIG